MPHCFKYIECEKEYRKVWKEKATLKFLDWLPEEMAETRTEQQGNRKTHFIG